MATSIPLADPSETLAAEGPRQLWHVPVFVAGLLALVGVWAGRPVWRETEAQQTARNLTTARRLIESSRPDCKRGIDLAQGVLDQSDHFPQLAGEAHFLVGSGHVREAGNMTEAAAAEAWQSARRHLEAAAKLGVPERDHARLMYRLARAWHHTGAPPQQVIDTLSASIEMVGEDLAEGYGVLTQAYLRLPQPDVASALLANKKHLDLPTDNDDLLAPVRFLRAQLLLRLQERDEARKVLEDVQPTAPSEIYSQARLLLAEMCQKDGHWAQGAKLWAEILRDQELPPAERGRMLYCLGVCQAMTGNAEAAADAWESSLRYEGEESRAAALRLAEMRLDGPRPARALECFERAAQGLTTPSNYHNPHVSLEDARSLFERGCQVYREAGEFERSQQLARLYEKLASPGIAANLFAQAAEAWAKEKDAAHDIEEARAHYRAAGAAYQAVADLATKPDALARWLWRSAECHIQGQDYLGSVSRLNRFLEVESSPEKLGEGWFVLAQVHLDHNDVPSANAAYHKCVEYGGPFAYRARYRLALAQIEEGNLDAAEESLRQNLDLIRAAPDEEAREKSLFTLAKLHYDRGNFRMAALRLQEGLDRYPENPHGAAYRLQFAECHRRMALQELETFRHADRATPEARAHYREQYRDNLEKAAAQFQKLVDDLTARQAQRAPTDGEQAVLRQAEFAAAECWFNLGEKEYQVALRQYQYLAARYRNRLESLVAMREACRCYWVLKDAERPRELVKQMHATLKALDESAFRDPQGMGTRLEWERWLEWAARQQ